MFSVRSLSLPRRDANEQRNAHVPCTEFVDWLSPVSQPGVTTQDVESARLSHLLPSNSELSMNLDGF